MQVNGDFDPATPLPAWASPSAVVLDALGALRPPARVKVSESAARRCVEVGGAWIPWDNGVAPYMVEPMDSMGSRRFRGVAFAGPARAAKSEALVVGLVTHTILAAPRLCHVVHMTRDAAAEFSTAQLGPAIRNSPELRERMRSGRGADNLFQKRFARGARVTIGWPVVTQLSARSIPAIALTDYDRMPEDVDGEGSAWSLAWKRTQSAGTRGICVAESSPGFPLEDESWTPSPSAPFEAPPTGGILSIYNTGTRGRWHWDCPSCGLAFQPSFDLLRYPPEGTPRERGRAAYLACPHCGGVVEHDRKAELNRAGRWLHEGPDGSPVPLAEARDTDVASYWLDGAAAAFAPWSDLVARVLEGEERFERTGDESALKAAVNLDLGRPFLSRARGVAEGMTEKALRAGASPLAFGEAPAGTACVVVSVDVQPGRFVVAAEAVRPGLERVLIDRFDIVTPPEGAPRPEGRAVDPGRYAEDWEALTALRSRRWKVAGADYELEPAAIICDAGGSPGVTPNAYAWWRRMRKLDRNRCHVVRGWGGERVKRAEVKRPETAHRGKKYAARDILLVRAGTDRLKDEIAASLSRSEGGERSLLIPASAPPQVFEEFAAERRGDKGWEKRPGVQRNEALDLAVYALALLIILGAESINWASPPAWARPDATNSFARREESAGDAPPPVEEPPETKAAAAGSKPEKPTARRLRRPRGSRRNFSGW